MHEQANQNSNVRYQHVTNCHPNTPTLILSLPEGRVGLPLLPPPQKLSVSYSPPQIFSLLTLLLTFLPLSLFWVSFQG